MIMEINRYKVNVIEKPTNIFGLKYEPQLEDKYDNDADIAYFHRAGFVEITRNKFSLMEHITKQYATHGIIEIGVHRNGESSLTTAILNNKPDNIPYLGIDIEDKSYLDNIGKKVFTIKENSFNQESIRNYANDIGIKKISVLVIDGQHSVNTKINDWKYADMLSDNGVVFLHCTNYHPGPALILPAIDEKIFRVENHFKNELDYGVAIIYKKI